MPEGKDYSKMFAAAYEKGWRDSQAEHESAEQKRERLAPGFSDLVARSEQRVSEIFTERKDSKDYKLIQTLLHTAELLGDANQQIAKGDSEKEGYLGGSLPRNDQLLLLEAVEKLYPYAANEEQAKETSLPLLHSLRLKNSDSKVAAGDRPFGDEPFRDNDLFETLGELKKMAKQMFDQVDSRQEFTNAAFLLLRQLARGHRFNSHLFSADYFRDVFENAVLQIIQDSPHLSKTDRQKQEIANYISRKS